MNQKLQISSRVDLNFSQRFFVWFGTTFITNYKPIRSGLFAPKLQTRIFSIWSTWEYTFHRFDQFYTSKFHLNHWLVFENNNATIDYTIVFTKSSLDLWKYSFPAAKPRLLVCLDLIQLFQVSFEIIRCSNEQLTPFSIWNHTELVGSLREQTRSKVSWSCIGRSNHQW